MTGQPRIVTVTSDNDQVLCWDQGRHVGAKRFFGFLVAIRAPAGAVYG